MSHSNVLKTGENMEDILKELEYNKEDILEGIKDDFDEEENASDTYDPIYLTTETPELTQTIKSDLNKPTIDQQLKK